MRETTDGGFPPGTIVVAAGIEPRVYEFLTSLMGVIVPLGTRLLIERSCDITQNFNQGVQKMTGEWVWFLGDDHAFSPHLLMRLLRFNQDVVVPITPCKTPPWAPCVMHGPVWSEKMPLYTWSELSGMGLLELPKGDFIGQAGMLVKKPVLGRIGYPWFKCGQMDPGRLQEDLTFCRELQTLGYKVMVDQESIFDHYVPFCVTARKHQGVWAPALKTSDDVVVVLPDAGTQIPTATEYIGKERVKWVSEESDVEVIGYERD